MVHIKRPHRYRRGRSTLIATLGLAVIPLALVFYLHARHLPSEGSSVLRRAALTRKDPTVFEEVGGILSSQLSGLKRPASVVLVTTNATTELEAAVEDSRLLRVTERRLYDVSKHEVTVQDVPARSTSRKSAESLVLVDWDALQRDCHILRQVLLEGDAPLSLNTKLLYWDMSASYKVVTCPDFDNFLVGKRSLVQGRYWNATRQWVEPGHVANYAAGVIHASLALRPAFVKALQKHKEERRRKTDVSFFWRKGGNLHYSFLRQQISYQLDTLSKKFRVSVCVRGDEDELEEQPNHPQTAYIQQLQSTKIVVLAQHDEWEDQYPLMEALAGGALVLVDSMKLPPQGLQNGTNCIVYNSARELLRCLEYYLDESNAEERLLIAKRGAAYASGSQRLTHRLESVIFGTAMMTSKDPQIAMQ